MLGLGFRSRMSAVAPGRPQEETGQRALCGSPKPCVSGATNAVPLKTSRERRKASFLTPGVARPPPHPGGAVTGGDGRTSGD